MDFKEKIKKLIDDGEEILKTKHYVSGQFLSGNFVDDEKFDSWENRITSVILNELKKDSVEYEFFAKKDTYSTNAGGAEKYQERLKGILKDLENGMLETPDQKQNTDALQILSNLFKRFPLVARQLEIRHQDRETIKITDEYDVQDLLHALLKLYFDNVKSEETCPSYAGAKARTDFSLEDENIFIEVKKTRKGLNDKEITKELVEDRALYSNHPNCKTLICFVYDPAHFISNKASIIKNLENTQDLNVKVFIES